MANELDRIIDISITRQTSAVSSANFGTPAIIDQFETDYTTVVFDRYRTYNSLTELTDDGWAVTDNVYLAAQKIFSQNPNPGVVFVGRKDRDDASWAAALTAIQNASNEFYGITAITFNSATQIVFDADFVASNSIDFTINGTAVTTVAFNTDQATTMADIKTQIESDITGSEVTIDSSDANTRTLYIDISGANVEASVVITGGVSQATGTASFINITLTTVVFSADLVASNVIASTVGGTTVSNITYATSHLATITAWVAEINSDISGSNAELDASDANNRTVIIRSKGKQDITTVTVTGGASQPTISITRALDVNIKAVAAWVETQRKLYFASSNDPDIINASSTTDIAYYLESQNYDRTIIDYHSSATPTFIESGRQGEAFPYDPGSQTWMFKTISGVASYILSSTYITAAHAKNCGTYLEVAGNDITEQGKVASGEYIDVMRGVDWIEASMQEDVFSRLINLRKVPYTDDGVNLIVGVVKSVLDEAVRNDILRSGTIEVTFPLVSEVSTTDRANRLLPDIEFTAELAGAIHKTTISGIVSV